MFVGHSDVMFGTASANAKWLKRLKDTHLRLGLCASPDDCFLAARGLRTLALRMRGAQRPLDRNRALGSRARPAS